MDVRHAVPQEGARLLASRIAGLELEEREAIRRRDWSAARSIALERVTLKTAYYRVIARRQGVDSNGSRCGGRSR